MDKKIFSRVGILIAVSLLALAAVQGVWLVKMYRDMNRNFSRQVTASLEKAAYDELISRNMTPSIKTDQKDVNSLFDSLATTLIDTTTFSASVAGKVRSITAFASMDTGEDETASLDVRQELDSTQITINISGDRDNVEGIAMIVSIPSTYTVPTLENVQKCDTLIGEYLRLAGIELPYRLQLRDNNSMQAVYSLHDDIPDAVDFEITADAKGDSSYVLSIARPGKSFLWEMSGIVLSSLLIVVLVGLVFRYLLRTMFRQKSLEKMRIDLTHNITHELKTPIAVASAAGEALTEFGAENDPAKRQEYLRVIGCQLETLSGMVDNILSMSLYEQSEYRLDFTDEPLRELIERQAQALSLYDNDRVSLHIDVPDNLTLNCDVKHLSTVIKNLLDNAVKYSPGRANVGVGARREEGKITITVSDDGIGIPKPSQGRIFEKFYRVPKGDLHDVKGFGLGLYYVKDMVEKHGGTITVTSREGDGTTFTITLPDNGQ